MRRNDGRESDKAPPKPRPITADWLFRAGAYYLERYASSTENLRRVLERKVVKRARALEADPGDFRAMIDDAVAKLAELKLVDDQAFAAGRFASLRRRGASTRMAGMKLAAKGVPRELVEEVIEGDTTSEAQAAEALARRRRIGVYRSGGEAERAEKRERDIAVLVRAGFSFSVARDAVDGRAPEE